MTVHSAGNMVMRGTVQTGDEKYSKGNKQTNARRLVIIILR